ncbi:hypothetical protein GGI24_000900 [Coemansia furcata]|nr:hypothetical protein GGI24_000900 [Coemansia furcata]
METASESGSVPDSGLDHELEYDIYCITPSACNNILDHVQGNKACIRNARNYPTPDNRAFRIHAGDNTIAHLAAANGFKSDGFKQGFEFRKLAALAVHICRCLEDESSSAACNARTIAESIAAQALEQAQTIESRTNAALIKASKLPAYVTSDDPDPNKVVSLSSDSIGSKVNSYVQQRNLTKLAQAAKSYMPSSSSRGRGNGRGRGRGRGRAGYGRSNDNSSQKPSQPAKDTMPQ